MQNSSIFLLSISKIANFARNKGFVSRSKTAEELVESVIRYLSKSDIAVLFEVCKNTAELVQRLSISIIDIYDINYPELLKQIADPPLLLFYKGEKALFQMEKISVVGTRKPSKLSVFATQKIPELFSKDNQIAIVSGLAAGIDREVMLSSLEKNIPTIGILGTGIGFEYPFSNKDLYGKMKESQKTLLISEMRPDEKFGKWSFPRRNRIITGLSKLLIVMEAPLKSGAISSARNALDQNREILVFDNESLFYNEGGRKLISDGAKHLTLDEILNKAKSISHISEYLSGSFKDIPKILSKLGMLEREGILKDMGGGYYLSLR